MTWELIVYGMKNKILLFAKFFKFKKGNTRYINNNIVGGDRIKKYPFYKQEEVYDCAAACLQMIISYYKGYLSLPKIRELLNITETGTSAYHIVKGASEIGFEAKGVKCNLDEINEDNIVLPCIANVIINNTYRHFVVIYKIDFARQTLLIADPANKMMKMSFDIFKSIFSGVMILLYPKDEIPVEAQNNFKLNLINHITKTHPELIKQLCFLSFFVTIFAIGGSFFLECISSSITSYQGQEGIILVLLLFIILTFLKNITEYFQTKILIFLSEKINLALTLDTFKKILSLPYKYYRLKTTGDLVTRILDISVIKTTISKLLLTVIIDIPLMLCSFIFLFLINSKLCLLTIIILILYIIIYFLFKDYFDDAIRKIKKDNVEATNTMLEGINNFETIKGLGIADTIDDVFEKKFVKLLRKTHKHDCMQAFQHFWRNLIADSGLIVIYSMGAILVINEKMTFGSLLSFGAILTYFFDPIKRVVSLEKDIREFDLALKRLMDISYCVINNGNDDIYKGDIKIRNLNYSYNQETLILENLNLDIKKGMKILILGPSGSGKSTLLKVLMKYYPVSRDTIYINDIDINDYMKTNGICYISQNENLFTDTLYNNLTLYQSINFSKVNEVVKMCYVDEIMKKSKNGFNMLLEENGFNLSGGERQRIVLARTLLKKFNILLIDEGLNQVDIKTEREILKNLFTKYRQKTIVIVSHRGENADLYDASLILKDGALTNARET